MKTNFRYFVAILAPLFAAGLYFTAMAASTISFLAVGAGDASSNDVILWTRAQDSASMAGVAVTAQVSTDATFATGVASFTGTPDPTQD